MEPVVDAVTFRQNDLPYTTFAAFEDMRKKMQLCDMTIRVQDHNFSAHRVIVAGVIPYFRNLLTSSEITAQDEEIGVDNVDPRALESLIDFAYTGEVNISVENVRSLLMASQFLLLNQVQDACVGFLTERLRVNNVVQVRTLGQSLSNLNLIANCDLYIRKSFEEFSKCDDFRSLPHSCIKEIISQDELNVASEEVVLEAVMNWVKLSPSDRHAVLPDLLSEVRMIYLPTDCLVNLVTSEELVRTSIPCRDLIDEVKNYHLLKGKSELSALKTEPRKSSVKGNPARKCSLALKGGIYAINSDHWNYISVFYCDLVHKKWNKVANKQASDSFAFAVATNEKIYMFLARTILTFDLKTIKWEVLQSSHDNIKATAVVLHQNMIYCFDESSALVKMCCYDVLQNKWVKKESVKKNRRYSAAATVGDSIYLTGGFIMEPGLTTRTVDTVEKYSPATNCWSEVSSMLTPRYSHCCTSLNGKIYVCGGTHSIYGRSEDIGKAEVYDPLTDQWNFISSMKAPRRTFSLVSCKNEIYAVGGIDKKCNPLDTETYDPEKKEWDTGFPVPYNFVSVVTVPTAST